jgi:CreA protein
MLAVILLSVWIVTQPERGTTGSVSTTFRLLGPNDKIIVDGFDDPKVEGVACHISRVQTGGMKGALGVAEDTSDASIACRQIGPIKIKGEIKDGERVFDERRSLLFKTLQVVRFFDKQRNVLVYVAYSDPSSKGAPRTASAAFRSWPGRNRRCGASCEGGSDPTAYPRTRSARTSCPAARSSHRPPAAAVLRFRSTALSVSFSPSTTGSS